MDEASISTIVRYGMDVRWERVLRQSLGEGYWVIEEGLGGRTSAFDDPFAGEDRNGKRYLPACLTSHQPLDLVILMLGTNDLKSYFNLSAAEIARGVGTLIGIVQNSISGSDSVVPKVLLICPPPIARLSFFARLFASATDKSRQLPAYYQQQAVAYGCEVLDAGQIITSSDCDGIHLEATEHQRLGQAVAERVRQILA